MARHSVALASNLVEEDEEEDEEKSTPLLEVLEVWGCHSDRS